MVKYSEYIQEEEIRKSLIIDINDFTDAELENSRLSFARNSKFIISVASNSGYPSHNKREIAFAGRSNVGKSSLINSITDVTGLARVSNTPGRTQMINFFSQDDAFFLVDLPGFGYAKASKDAIKKWKNLTYDYLQGRKELELVLFLIDSRHGIKEIDENIMDILDSAAVSYQIIMTKYDKINKSQSQKLIETTNEKISKRGKIYS